MTQRDGARSGALLIALSACGFGSIPIFVSFATASGAPLLAILAWRFIIGALLLITIAGPQRMRQYARFGPPIVLFGGVGQAIVNGVSLSALRWIPVATLSFLFYTYPAWVAAFAAARGTEPLTMRRAVALLIALAGVAVMIGNPLSGHGPNPIGLGLALFSAIAYALYIPLLDRLQKPVTPAVAAAYVASGTAVVMTTVAITTSVFTATFHRAAWISIAGLAVVSTTMAFIAFLRGLARLGPVRTAIVSTVEPFFTAMLAAWLLAQPIPNRTFLGGVLIATAVIMVQWRSA
ncbi:MAG: protein of unknown function transrane [Gemmatimonadetes bacterium]|nr:protein of unknown function transrane [Gemmatimonadota bacterium]